MPQLGTASARARILSRDLYHPVEKPDGGVVVPVDRNVDVDIEFTVVRIGGPPEKNRAFDGGGVLGMERQPAMKPMRTCPSP